METVNVTIQMSKDELNNGFVAKAVVPDLEITPEFFAPTYHAAIGRLVCSQWSTEVLYRNGARAVKFSFLDMPGTL